MQRRGSGAQARGPARLAVATGPLAQMVPPGPHNSQMPSRSVLQALHCHLFPGGICSLGPALLSVTGSASSHTLNCDSTCLHFPLAERWFRVFQMDLTPTYHDSTGEQCVLIPCPLLLEWKPSPSTEPVPDSHNSPQPRTQGFTPRS